MELTRNQRRGRSRILEKFRNTLNLVREADSPGGLRNALAGVFGRKVPEPGPQCLPLKHLRLGELAQAKFNVANFQAWLRGELNLEELFDFERKHSRLSLRTFTEEHPQAETPKLPVAYEQSNQKAIFAWCKEQNESYHVLVNEALPLRDSLAAGNIILLDGKQYVASYFEGYGTPRDVDDKPATDLRAFKRAFGESIPLWAPQEISKLAAQLRSFRSDFRPMTVEFSIYPYPVGIFGREEVLWEWRGGSAHDLATLSARLIERVEKFEVAFDLK